MVPMASSHLKFCTIFLQVAVTVMSREEHTFQCEGGFHLLSCRWGC